MAIANLFLQK